MRTPCDKHFAVHAEGNAGHTAKGFLKTLFFLASGQVPQLCGVIRAAGGEPLRVTAQYHGRNSHSLPVVSAYFLAARNIPQLGGACLACGNEPTTVAAQGHSCAPWTDHVKTAYLFTAVYVP